MNEHEVDIGCILEVDTGSSTCLGFNQFDYLLGEDYPHGDVENKYAKTSPLRRMPITKGKSNGFISLQWYDFSKLYFQNGTKRLVYQLRLEPELTLFFTHFSLNYKIRRLQLQEMFDIADQTSGEIILMGDFNILKGMRELETLLASRPLKLMNDPNKPTYSLYRRNWVLDLCMVSEKLAEHAEIEILPQPYSDHAAVLLKIS